MARDSMGGGFMSRLTPRERTYIMVLVLVFFGMGTLVMLYLRDKALRDIEDGISATRRALDAVHTRGAVYKERLAEKEEREAKISSDQVLFSTLVEESSVVGESIKVSNEEELTPLDVGAGLTKRSYKFNLSSITLEDLVKFLTKIESKPGHVIITDNIIIRSPSPAEDRLNVEVTIATWERRADKDKDKAADESDEEGAGS